MKRHYASVVTLLCLSAIPQFCAAQASPWNGAWKADNSSLKFDGATFSVATSPDGYTITRSGTASPKVVCDAKPHETPDGVLTCTKAGAGYSLALSKDGKPVRKATVTLSADGKTRTTKSEALNTGSTPNTITTTSQRVSGGPGMAGTWKETRTAESLDTGVLSIKVTGNTIAFKETDQDKATTCKLDGTETKIDGLGSISIKLADPHTLKVKYSSGGKVRRENTFVLSADGKSITETDVTPAPSPSTMTVTLHKS